MNRNILIILILLTPILLIYSQVVQFGYINFDDNQYVYENPHVQKGITAESISWAFTSIYAANWHPVTWLSHMLDISLFGMNPGMHHLVNVIFHIFNTLLLFFVFREMTGKSFQSAVIAILFAVHPLHVESVAWIAERKDVLSSFFWMLTLWAYIRYVKASDIKFYLVMHVFFALGLMSKPMLVTLPFVLMLLDYWPLKRIHSMKGDDFNATGNIKKIFIEKVPLLIMSIASCWLTYIAQKHGGAMSSAHVYPFDLRIANVATAYIGYIGKIFWPFHLSIFYPLPMKIALWKSIGSTFLLAVMTFLFCIRMRQNRYLTVGWFWYLGTLVPVIGLVQVGLQAMADRYAYIPSIGIFIVIAWGIPGVISKAGQKEFTLVFPVTVFSILLMILSWFQVNHWSGSIALFNNAIRHTDHNYIAHNNLGLGLIAEGRVEEAIEQFRLALENHPYPERPYTNMGHALFLQHHYNEAIRYHNIALDHAPDFFKAHNNLGVALAAEGRFDEAISHYLKAIKLAPDAAEIYNNLGVAFSAEEKYNDAVKYFLWAVKKNPAYAEAYNNLGLVFARNGQLIKAHQCFQEAVRLKPGFLEARKNSKRAALDINRNKNNKPGI